MLGRPRESEIQGGDKGVRGHGVVRGSWGGKGCGGAFVERGDPKEGRKL